MKKLIIIIVGVILLAEANPVQPATLEVRAPGGIGTLGDVYTNIQQAIDDASPGDTINVAAGVYDGNTVGPEGHLIIDKANLTLKSAAGKVSTTIKVANGVGIDIRGGAANFVLGGASGQGFTIAGKSDTTFVIQLANAPSGVTISHNTISTTGNASMGVSVGAAGAADLTISNNDFIAEDGDGSIWGPDVYNVTVSDNTFTGPATPTSGYAIQFAGVTSASPSTINGNTIENYGSGIFIHTAGATTVVSGLTINDNSVSGCLKGIRLGHSTQTLDMDDVTVTGNTLSNNTAGLYIDNNASIKAGQFTVQDNCITGNTTGLDNQHTSELVTAEENAWGDADGPYHPDTNPYSSGDPVSDNVDYYPWYPDCNFTTPVYKRVHNITLHAYYDTIQDAFDAARSGDIIEADAGTYREDLAGWKDMEILTSLTIRGAGSGSTIVELSEGNGLGGKMNGVEIRGSNLDVTIEGITFTKTPGNTYATSYPIRVAETSSSFNSLTLKDVEVGYAEAANVLLGGNGSYTNVHIEDCNFHHGGTWGFLGSGTINGMTVIDSDFEYNGQVDPDHGNGFDLTGTSSTNVTVTGGSFSNNKQAGINLMRISNSSFTGCVANNNAGAGGGGFGIKLDEWGGKSHDIVFDRCTASGNSKDGITIQPEKDDAIEDVLITDSVLTGNGRNGLNLCYIYSGSNNPEMTNVRITCSTLSGNGNKGVEVYSWWEPMIITEVFDAKYNWWGYASGPSGEGGGSGDAVSANVDFFPWLLTEDCNDFTAVAADFVVDDDWDGYDDWTTVTVNGTDYYIGINAFAAIQDAIDEATDGNSISVADGNYVGAVLDKDVTLIGANPAESVISTGVPYKAGGGPLTGFRLDAGADGAEIRNFVLDCNRDDSFFFAVFSRNADDVVIDSLTVNKPVQGISNWGGSNWQITNNQLNETEAAGGGGIAILVGANAGYPTAQGNVIKNNVMTPAATAPDFTCPAVCLCLDLRYGGYESMTGNEDVSYNQISENEITGTGLGSEVGVEAGVIGVSDDPNKIAATLGMVHDNLVTANIIDNTDMGVYLYTVTDMAVLGNEIVDCNDAIHIEDSHKNLHVNYNAIIASKTYGLNNAGGIEVDAEYNWWADVTGPNDPCGTSETDGATCYDTEDIKNADGLGDAVTDNADYCPWLLAPISTSVYSYMPGDLDYDGDVDWRDFAIFAENWLEGTTP